LSRNLALIYHTKEALIDPNSTNIAENPILLYGLTLRMHLKHRKSSKLQVFVLNDTFIANVNPTHCLQSLCRNLL